MNKAAAVFLLLFALFAPPGLYPDTLRLHTDSVAAMVLGGPPLCQVAEGGRFRWESGELQPIEGLFSFYTMDQQPLEARFEVTPSASRGEVLTGYLGFSEAVNRLEATLRDSGGEAVGSARGFPVDDSERRWCFLLGIASTAAAGQYSLELRAHEGRRFILGTGCVTPIVAPTSNIQAARKAVGA